MALKRAKEYVDELHELSPTNKAALKETFPDLTQDSPQTISAVRLFRNTVRKVAPAAGEVLKSILADVVTETVKKHLGF